MEHSLEELGQEAILSVQAGDDRGFHPGDSSEDREEEGTWGIILGTELVEFLLSIQRVVCKIQTLAEENE